MKADNLARMRAHGLPVPEFAVFRRNDAIRLDFSGAEHFAVRSSFHRIFGMPARSRTYSRENPTPSIKVWNCFDIVSFKGCNPLFYFLTTVFIIMLSINLSDIIRPMRMLIFPVMLS